jgi:hypothetical protein
LLDGEARYFRNATGSASTSSRKRHQAKPVFGVSFQAPALSAW